ncbi:MAG: copper amine oxidase N-terminal domain-containing protein [Clostridia bacterium]|nr:copper amine oxidase N-terminal domain-containing protein [Clostridia bacterium]
MSKKMVCLLCILLFGMSILPVSAERPLTEETYKAKLHAELLKLYMEEEQSSGAPQKTEILVQMKDRNMSPYRVYNTVRSLVENNFTTEGRVDGGLFVLSFANRRMALAAAMSLNQVDMVLWANLNVDATLLKKPVGNEIRFQIGSNQVKIFGNEFWIDYENPQVVPYLEEDSGRTMIPLVALTAICPVTTAWNAETREVTVSGMRQNVRFKIGDPCIKLSAATRISSVEKEYVSDAVPQITEDRTFLPLRLCGDLWGFDVTWIPKTREIVLKEKAVEQLVDFEPYWEETEDAVRLGIKLVNHAPVPIFVEHYSAGATKVTVINEKGKQINPIYQNLAGGAVTVPTVADREKIFADIFEKEDVPPGNYQVSVRLAATPSLYGKEFEWKEETVRVTVTVP